MKRGFVVESGKQPTKYRFYANCLDFFRIKRIFAVLEDS